MDDASEDEDQVHATTSQASNQQAMRPGPAISQDHFSSVLAMLNQQQSRTTQQTSNVQSQQRQQQPAQSTGQSSGFFDRNHFQNIMQQIMNQQQTTSAQSDSQVSATSGIDTANNPTTSASSESNLQSSGMISSDLAAKLEQMHELGFLDDVLNTRALEITEGNVDAAVSLLIEGGNMI